MSSLTHVAGAAAAAAAGEPAALAAPADLEQHGKSEPEPDAEALDCTWEPRAEGGGIDATGCRSYSSFVHCANRGPCFSRGLSYGYTQRQQHYLPRVRPCARGVVRIYAPHNPPRPACYWVCYADYRCQWHCDVGP